MSDAQFQKVNRTVTKALAQGYAVSVFDGEETVVSKSTDHHIIMSNVRSTDEETLTMWDGKRRIGSILLVWEFNGDADEVINDYTDNEAIVKLLGGCA